MEESNYKMKTVKIVYKVKLIKWYVGKLKAHNHDKSYKPTIEELIRSSI